MVRVNEVVEDKWNKLRKELGITWREVIEAGILAEEGRIENKKDIDV